MTYFQDLQDGEEKLLKPILKVPHDEMLLSHIGM